MLPPRAEGPAEVGDVAHPWRSTGDRPVVEAGAPAVDEQVPHVGVAVDERPLTLVPQRHHVSGARHVELTELPERGRHVVDELLERELDELPPTAICLLVAPVATEARRDA
jgi:hypothetical protein